MKMLKKTIHILDRIEDTAAFILCLILFFVGMYALIDSYLVYQHANDTSLLKYKPGYESTAEDKAIIGNMVAWLTVDDTNIDYPIMQGKNNEEYLNKDPYGEYSLSGSIFLDFRNSPDFTDSYSLIYGHHMEGNYMFGALHSFLEEDFFNEHTSGSLIAGDTNYDLKIFAVLNTEATKDIIFSPTQYKLSEVLSYVKENSEFINSSELEKIESDISTNGEAGTSIIALSTCKHPDTVYRVVVFAHLTNPTDIEKAE